MHYSKALIVFGIVLLASGPSKARAEAEPVVLQAGNLAALFGAADGRLLSLAIGGHELLVSPGQLTLQVDKAAPIALARTWKVFHLRGAAAA